MCKIGGVNYIGGVAKQLGGTPVFAGVKIRSMTRIE